MRHKWILWMMALLLCIAPVMAQDGCRAQQVCTWWSYIQDADTARLSILDPNGSYIVRNASMGQVESDIWQYNITLNKTGNYFGKTIFENSSSQVGTSVESKQIWGLGMLAEVFWVLLIFLIGMSLAAIGTYMKNIALLMAGGIWFLATAFSGLASIEGAPYIGGFIFLLVGLGIVMQAVFIIWREGAPNRR